MTGLRLRRREGRWENEWHAKLADIFKTLASEAFAERLLGKATVDAFCTQTKNSRAVVYVFLSPNLRKVVCINGFLLPDVSSGTGRNRKGLLSFLDRI